MHSSQVLNNENSYFLYCYWIKPLALPCENLRISRYGRDSSSNGSMEDDSREDGQDDSDYNYQRLARHCDVIFKSFEVMCFDIQRNPNDTHGSSNRVGFSIMECCIQCDRILE